MTIPLRYVSDREFFAVVGPRDVHPRPEPDRSVWIDQRTRTVVGITTPGYLCNGPKTYALTGD